MFKPKWQFYEHLSFLADMITPRRTFSNLDEDSGSNYDENGENLYPDDSGFSPPGLPPKNAKGKKKWTPFEQTMVAAASTLKSISERPIQHPNQPPSAVAAAPAPKSADDLFGETVANLMSAIPDSYEKDMIKIEIGAYNALLVDLPKTAHRDYQRFMRMNEETFQVKKVIFVCGHLKKK